MMNSMLAAVAAAGAVGEGQGDGLIFFAEFARQADTDQALGVGEDDTAIDVIPSITLVALHHRELHAVDQNQLFQGQLECLGH